MCVDWIKGIKRMHMKTDKEKALEIADILTDYKGADTVVLDVSELSSWTDFFVITTVNSSAHWKGLYRQVKDYAKENDLAIRIPDKKLPSGDDWNLIDMSTVVVHLMTAEARSFYDLEKLWHGGKKLL